MKIEVKDWIYIFLISTLLLIIIFGGNKLHDKYMKNESVIEELETENDKLDAIIEKLEIDYDSIMNISDSIKIKSDSLSGVIDKISNQIAVKEDSIDKLVKSQLQDFFDNRYPSSQEKRVSLDTIQASEAIKDIVKSDILKEKVELLESRASLLEESNLSLRNGISNLYGRVDALEKQKENLERIVDGYSSENEYLKRKVRRQAFATKLTGGAGVLAVVAIVLIAL